MKPFIDDCLFSEHSAVRRYFDDKYIRQLVVKHEGGDQNYMRHVYLLISFELWHQQFISA
jgi:asparagine synthase (glutamine-hydrolysing)